MRFPFDFSKLSFFGEFLGSWDAQKNWDFLGIFLGISWDVQKNLGFLGIFLGFFQDPRKSGIFLGFFWDFARLLEYSDIFYVSLRRFWILLLRALVTHT